MRLLPPDLLPLEDGRLEAAIGRSMDSSFSSIGSNKWQGAVWKFEPKLDPTYGGMLCAHVMLMLMLLHV